MIMHRQRSTLRLLVDFVFMLTGATCVLHNAFSNSICILYTIW